MRDVVPAGTTRSVIGAFARQTNNDGSLQRLPAVHGGRAVQNLMVCRGKHRLTVKNCTNLVQKSFKIRWHARGMHLLGSYSGGFFTTLVLTAVGGLDEVHI